MFNFFKKRQPEPATPPAPTIYDPVVISDDMLTYATAEPSPQFNKAVAFAKAQGFDVTLAEYKIEALRFNENVCVWVHHGKLMSESRLRNRFDRSNPTRLCLEIESSEERNQTIWHACGYTPPPAIDIDDYLGSLTPPPAP